MKAGTLRTHISLTVHVSNTRLPDAPSESNDKQRIKRAQKNPQRSCWSANCRKFAYSLRDNAITRELHRHKNIEPHSTEKRGCQRLVNPSAAPSVAVPL